MVACCRGCGKRRLGRKRLPDGAQTECCQPGTPEESWAASADDEKRKLKQLRPELNLHLRNAVDGDGLAGVAMETLACVSQE